MTDTSLLLTSEDLEKEHRMFLRRLAADTKKAASLLKPTEARYLVDLYYQIQDFRKAAANQARSHKQFGEPNYLVGFVGDQMQAMENLIRRSMGHYAASDPTGLWSQSIVGVGPVTSAALLAHIDIRKANTVGKIWRFGGLDPTVTWNKGQKRPWNAKLKVVLWHIGECFKKFSKREDCLYGRLYRVRKQFEINRNESGANKETARITLETKKIGKDTPTYAAYAQGKLPPGRLDLRATRFATKIFLSHWHEVAYRYHHGEKPARPYAIAILGHADYIPVPNYPWDDDAKQQEVFEFWDRMFKAVPVAAADETEESEDEDAE